MIFSRMWVAKGKRLKDDGRQVGKATFGGGYVILDDNKRKKVAENSGEEAIYGGWRGVMIAIVILLLVGGLFVWERNKRHVEALAFSGCKGTIGIQPGQCAPNFTSPVLQNGEEGKQVSLSEYGKKPLFLYFFSKNCGICIEDFPKIKELQARYRGKINFLYIDAMYEKSNIKELQSLFTSPHPVTGQPLQLDPVILGDKKVTESIYPVFGTPVLYFIDATGHIVRTVPGLDRQLEAHLEEILDTHPSS